GLCNLPSVADWSSPRLRRVAQLHPDRSMVARVVLAANGAVDAGGDEASRPLGTQEDLVKPEPGVALPPFPHVVPESVHGRGRVKGADGVEPTLPEQTLVGLAARGLQQRVVVVRL